jgi:protoporphyrinogen/coproporphyrinogen III oxidase
VGMGLDLLRTASQSRMYSFREGTETLPRRLRESLEGKVTVRTDSPVQTIRVEGDEIKIRTPLQTQVFSHVISTIPLPKLFRVLPSFPSDVAQSFPPAVTVAVVNLYYPGGSILMPIHGFGYLIPQKTTPTENPEDALGVIIVSDGLQGQDSGKYESGVKLTVMLGGHYWRDRASLPSDDELLSAAKTVVARDLNISAEPALSNVSLQRECIPQYEVGHWERIEKVNGYLDSTFGPERFKVVGSSVDGVGVNDCILSARKAARRIQELTMTEDMFEE